ncbi:hypothetical protein PM082_018140 [Marasmius tenuissimus]|nr:hypothetical protein PM082_018140 [Marasmius tenuissimus]
MHFFEGARSLESDSLNIYVDHASWEQFLPFLLNVGYEYSAEHPQPTTLSALFNWVRYTAEGNIPTMEFRVDGTRGVVTTVHFVRMRSGVQQRLNLVVTNGYPMVAILSMKSTCNVAIIAGTYAISIYPYSTHHREEGIVNCRPPSVDTQSALDSYVDLGYTQHCSPFTWAVLKRSTEFARHRQLGGSASWNIPLHGKAIAEADESNSAYAIDTLPSLKMVS